MSGCFSADRNGPITRSERICVLVRTPVTVGGREINAGWKSRKVTLSRVTHPPTFWLAMAWMVVGRRDRGEEPLAAHARATEGTRAGTGRPEPFADVATPEQTLPSPECRNPIEVDRGAWVSSQAATWSRTTTATAPAGEAGATSLPSAGAGFSRGRRDACADAIAGVGQRPGQRDECAQEAAQLSDRMRAVGWS